LFDALARAPRDAQAKLNLEWALRALASEPPPAPEPSEASEGPPPPDAESEASEPEPAPVPEAAPAAEDARAGEPGAPEAALAPEDVARWLDAVRDEPLPALRALLEEGTEPRTGPQW
jgi:hypothetical protein